MSALYLKIMKGQSEAQGFKLIPIGNESVEFHESPPQAQVGTQKYDLPAAAYIINNEGKTISSFTPQTIVGWKIKTKEEDLQNKPGFIRPLYRTELDSEWTRDEYGTCYRFIEKTPVGISDELNELLIKTATKVLNTAHAPGIYKYNGKFYLGNFNRNNKLVFGEIISMECGFPSTKVKNRGLVYGDSKIVINKSTNSVRGNYPATIMREFIPTPILIHANNFVNRPNDSSAKAAIVEYQDKLYLIIRHTGPKFIVAEAMFKLDPDDDTVILPTEERVQYVRKVTDEEWSGSAFNLLNYSGIIQTKNYPSQEISRIFFNYFYDQGVGSNQMPAIFSYMGKYYLAVETHSPSPQIYEIANLDETHQFVTDTQETKPSPFVIAGWEISECGETISNCEVTESEITGAIEARSADFSSVMRLIPMVLKTLDGYNDNRSFLIRESNGDSSYIYHKLNSKSHLYKVNQKGGDNDRESELIAREEILFVRPLTLKEKADLRYSYLSGKFTGSFNAVELGEDTDRIRNSFILAAQQLPAEHIPAILKYEDTNYIAYRHDTTYVIGEITSDDLVKKTTPRLINSQHEVSPVVQIMDWWVEVVTEKMLPSRTAVYLRGGVNDEGYTRGAIASNLVKQERVDIPPSVLTQVQKYYGDHIPVILRKEGGIVTYLRFPHYDRNNTFKGVLYGSLHQSEHTQTPAIERFRADDGWLVEVVQQEFLKGDVTVDLVNGCTQGSIESKFITLDQVGISKKALDDIERNIMSTTPIIIDGGLGRSQYLRFGIEVGMTGRFVPQYASITRRNLDEAPGENFRIGGIPSIDSLPGPTIFDEPPTDYPQLDEVIRNARNDKTLYQNDGWAIINISELAHLKHTTYLMSYSRGAINAKFAPPGLLGLGKVELNRFDTVIGSHRAAWLRRLCDNKVIVRLPIIGEDNEVKLVVYGYLEDPEETIPPHYTPETKSCVI